MRTHTLAAAGAAVGAAAFLAPGVFLSRMLHRAGFDPASDRLPAPFSVRITAIAPGRLTLRPGPAGAPGAHLEPGRYLLEAARGRAFLGPVLESNGVVAIREFAPLDGDLRPGDFARLDPFAFPGDPREAHGIDFDEVDVPAPLGRFPAWYVRGRRDTWAVMVHGKGANRRETLRLLPLLVEAGYPALAITYRNDEGCPQAPHGRYSYGRDEYEELEAAVRFALELGARRILLVGYSMGGAICLSFMERSNLASRAAGFILDAPMLDLRTTVAHGARQRRIPLWYLAVSNRIAARRYRFNWDDFDYRRTAMDLQVPILLFHGDADPTVPVETSDALAAARPDIVRYVRVPGAGHVRAWNVDPGGYADAVRAFLAALG
ncbi:MAG: alpha/beta fold hydrolase [Dehalococcoidia bacterium]|nr:alpha/beta fold hydrolase [Dehalococcoidia bacterium]